MGLVARTEDIFHGKPTGCNSERTTMAVVAQINDDADRWLRSIVGGWPLAGSVLQAAAKRDINAVMERPPARRDRIRDRRHWRRCRRPHGSSRYGGGVL